MVEVWLPYGKTEVCVSIPTRNLQDIIEPKDQARAENPQLEIESALMNPIDASRLAEIAKSGNRVSIVLKDSGDILNELTVLGVLKELNSVGVRDEDVTLIVAYDPFRPFSAQETRSLVSSEFSTRIKVLSHMPEGTDSVQIGTTTRGTDVRLSKTFMDTDVKVLVGVVEPHPIMGYTGGSEGVLPGVADAETVQRNLLLALDLVRASRGNLEGNPVHEDMVEAAHLAKVDFALAVVRNRKLEIARAFAGGVDSAFAEAVKVADEMYKIPVESRADIVFTSAGGTQFDSNLFEACEGLDSALSLVRKGKVAVLVAECMNGCGNVGFTEALSRFKDPKTLQRALKKSFGVGGLMAYRLLTALQNTELILVSVIPDYLVSDIPGLRTARTANEALRLACDKVGKNGKVSVIPQGRSVIPLVKAAERNLD